MIRILIFFALTTTNIFSQINNVIYCPSKTVRTIHFLSTEKKIISDGYSTIFLLNKNNLITDTLYLQNGFYQNLTITSDSTFSLMYINFVESYIIRNSKFVVDMLLATTKAYENEKKYSNYVHKDYIFVKNKSFSTGYTKYKNYLIGNVLENKKNYGFCVIDLNTDKQTIILEPYSNKEKVIKKTYDGFLITANRFFHDNSVFLNVPLLNKCIVYNFKTKKIKQIIFPEIDKKEKASWLYFYDIVSKHDYLIKFHKNGLKELYKLDIANKNLEFICSLKKDFVTILNDKFIIKNKWEGDKCFSFYDFNKFNNNNSNLLPDVKIVD